MMFLKYIKIGIAFGVLMSFCKVSSQPYTEISGLNVQTFSAPYRKDASIRNTTNIYTLNALFPKTLKNGNSLLLRFNGESIHSQTDSNQFGSSTVSSVSLCFGFQWVSKNEQYKTTLFVLPKLASDFKQTIRNQDWQYGALFLESYRPNSKLQFKAGLYYNKEAFGDFFVPLFGIDWKATDRIYLYGVLPSNYKIEYEVSKRWYTGISFKSMTRSFRLSESKNNDYIRFDETVLKYFVEHYIAKNLVFSGEVGYAFGKNLRQYKSDNTESSDWYFVNGPLKNYAVFTFGLAYRIRNE
jgi:hypothetical protein